MNPRRAHLLVAFGCLALGACGASDSAGGEAAENEATANSMGNGMMNDPNSPFAQSEMQMNHRMMTAIGVNVGDSWARKMIEHHQGAIDMSRIFIQQNRSGDATTLAQQTIDKQTREIADLRKLVRDGSPNQQSSEVYRPAMMQMHRAMMAAKGSDVTETFLRKMLEHHRGGVSLSDVALENGVTGTVRTQAQKTRESQANEAEIVEAMLRGEPLTRASQEVKPMAAPPAKAADPAPAKTRTETARSRTDKPKPTGSAKPETGGPAPAATCAPEHRAAGHC